ncbi:MAG: 4Fe-4S ferredoxin [Denitrovibrio sp.]|nr:MAG: 4Fe-4S ferredoxin [Denitrovibrio sp.]
MNSFLKFAATVIVVVALSAFSASIWGGKPEKLPDNFSLKITEQMTVQQFIDANNMERQFAKGFLGLADKNDLQKNISEFGSVQQLQSKYKKSLALKTEHETKNWFKIPLKFALWSIFLGVSFFLLSRGKIKSANRKWLYGLSFLIFGIIMGADPSPMGTVKDAVYLYGKAGAIFPPRMIALSVFLLTVLIANKFICSWGCQFGTLQDFIFRLGSNKNDTKPSAVQQYKMPFVVSNTFRALIFGLMFFSAFMFAYDLFEIIDPFKIFKPMVLGIAGGTFIAVMLILSIFTYRPWCLLFCPFGFVGWLVEKLSIFKIRVNYDTCIACQKCSLSCPSTVMDAILKQDKKTVPDCFSCGVCIEVCPTKSVTFSKGRRAKVPEGKFR